MSNLNNFEGNDFDSFLNLDNDFTPTTTSPSVPSLAHQSSASSSTTLTSSQPVFSAPSYQYDSHRQQTGLPMGGLANTMAINQNNGLHYRTGNMGFVMPTETLNLPLSNLDDFDYGRSQFDMNDMDFDADSPSELPSMFYPSGSTQIKTESSQSAPIQRIYPGMHSQQAARDKQRQQELLRQQQSQGPKQIPGQLPLPTQAPKVAKDPHVEESISRLLSRMRQSSASSVDEASTPAPNTGVSSIPKPKKDEDDMDDDERLLASEEGKKLSSKERRQLRNKVSARAFRSRRKEYIGQLEGEVAAKVQEANDLRVQNRQLMEENTRLTDLTRMLLSSPSFAGFLQELSNSGMTLPSTVSAQQQPQQPQRQTRKDVPVHDASRQLQNQNQQHVGMTLIPETNIDIMSDFSNSWNVPLPSNDFQVFSVTDLPQPPELDLSAMSEKRSSEIVVPALSSKDTLQLSTLPPPIETVVSVEDNSKVETNAIEDNSDDLYAESSVSEPATQSVEAFLETLRKPTSETQTMVAADEHNDAELSSRLDQMCALLDRSCSRLENFLP